MLWAKGWVKSFAIDVNYKHVRGTGEKEFIIATWDPDEKISTYLILSNSHFTTNTILVIVLARGFISSEKRQMFTLLFQTYFTLLRQLVGYEFRIKGIHGDGLLGVTMDQGTGQVTGMTPF
jgi:hypothetical protein